MVLPKPLPLPPTPSYTQTVHRLSQLDSTRLARVLDAVSKPPVGKSRPSPVNTRCSPPPLADSPTSPSLFEWQDHLASPPSSPEETSEHARKVRHSRKLSHFFGETIPLDPAEQVKQHRRDTLDGVLGEMWKSLQHDVGTGKVVSADAERLGEMMRGLSRRSRLGWDS